VPIWPCASISLSLLTVRCPAAAPTASRLQSARYPVVRQNLIEPRCQCDAVRRSRRATSVSAVLKAFCVVKSLGFDSVNLRAALFRSRVRLAAENLFLRKQLTLFQERKKKARPTTAADRFVLCRPAYLFDWRDALVIVKPGTLIGWHRSAFRHFWHWKSRPVGRPPLPVKLKCLIRRMAAENPTWGEERIADELRLKLGIRVSPRTVSKYLTQQPSPARFKGPGWAAFLRNHAQNIVACDFFVAVTARFRILYVFVVLEIGSRHRD
jgi:putative transposase